jgi:AbrB family looped-hinge helix DNA binding protein
MIVEVDAEGRVTIPHGMLEKLGWKEGDEVIITPNEDGTIMIVLSKESPTEVYLKGLASRGEISNNTLDKALKVLDVLIPKKYHSEVDTTYGDHGEVLFLFDDTSERHSLHIRVDVYAHDSIDIFFRERTTGVVNLLTFTYHDILSMPDPSKRISDYIDGLCLKS